MSYAQQQFQQHLSQLRTYSYIQGKDKELKWLLDKYAEKQLTESLERDFVNDFDAHLEELANTLSNEDFKSTFAYWVPLAEKHWNGDQRDVFFKKLKRLRGTYETLSAIEEAKCSGRWVVKDVRTLNSVVRVVFFGGACFFIFHTLVPDSTGWGRVFACGIGVFCALISIGGFYKDEIYICPFCGYKSKPTSSTTCQGCKATLSN